MIALPAQPEEAADSKIVSVFGSALPEPGSAAYQTAYELGRAIAEAGWTLCNGGYGGTMEAAARGAAERGGHVIGVTCSGLRGRGGPNRFVRQEIPTSDLLTRLDTLVRTADAFVVLPGGTGTLLELAYVWEMLNKGMLEGSPPAVLLGDRWRALYELVREGEPGAFALVHVHTVTEAVAAIRGRIR